MIEFKFFTLCVLLVLSPQQKKSGETDSSAATSRTIQGGAIFADGESLADAELEFKLSPIGEVSMDKDRDFKVEYLRCKTNSEGSFQLELPTGVEYSVEVVATKLFDGERRYWHCKIPKLSSKLRRPLELVFENRGRVFLGFLGTSNLPPDVEPTVFLSSKGGDRLNRPLEPNSRGRMVIDGLEPGEYQIEVYAIELSAKSWKQSVTVPSDPPYRAVATIKFPEFKFGTFRAIVMLPDGKTPAANIRLMATSVNENSRGFGRKELMTDSKGLVTAKMAVGKIQLTCDPKNDGRIGEIQVDIFQGIAPGLFSADVKADELTEMGTLRLQKEEEVFAWIEGTIKYADGTPLENHFSGGDLFSMPTGLPLIGTESSFKPEKAGGFSTRVRAGKLVIAIGLEGTGKPLGAAGGFIMVGERSDEKYLLLPLDLAAGERIHRDVVLPVRKSDRRLMLDFQEPSSVAVLLVEIAPGVVWRCETRFEKGYTDFENVPAGEALIVVATNECDYVAFRKIGAGSGNEEIDFSKQDVGKLQFAINDVGSLETESFVIQLSADSPLGSLAMLRVGAEHPNLKRNADGSFVLNGVAAGKYRVTIGDGKVQHEQQCEIESGNTTKLQF